MLRPQGLSLDGEAQDRVFRPLLSRYPGFLALSGQGSIPPPAPQVEQLPSGSRRASELKAASSLASSGESLVYFLKSLPVAIKF